MADTDLNQLLRDPQPGVSLADLKSDLNRLATLRGQARLAFCKRLAIVYMLIVGRVPTRKAPKDGESKKFFAWCDTNLHSGTGKPYGEHALRNYYLVGFSGNPAAAMNARQKAAVDNVKEAWSVRTALKNAIKTPTPLKAVSVIKLRSRYDLPTNVAQEVNAMMTAWEAASSQARNQFIYMVTGKRMAA